MEYIYNKLQPQRHSVSLRLKLPIGFSRETVTETELQLLFCILFGAFIVIPELQTCHPILQAAIAP